MRRSELAQRKRERIDAITGAVMATRQGRAHVWRILTQFGLQSSSFVPGDQMSTAYNEGRRSVVLALAAEYQRACPDQYATMMREALEEAELERRDLAKADPDEEDETSP